MISKTLAEFVALESQFRELEARRDEIRKKIVSELQSEGIKKVQDPTLGTFTVSHKVTYSFSPAVTKLEEKVKIAKQKEKDKGIAEIETDTSFLLYTEPKL